MHLLSILELSLAEDGPDLTTEGVFGPGTGFRRLS